MSIAVANAASGGTESGTSLTALPASAINSTTGNLLLVFVRYGTGTVDSISDTAGNTFTPDTAASIASGNEIAVYYCANATGNASNVVQANSTAGIQYASIHVLEISGVATSSPTDVGVSASASTSPSFSTTQADEIIVTLGTANGGTNIEPATIGGTTATVATQIGAPNYNTVSAYVIESATQSGITANWGPGTSPSVSVVSLKAAGGGPTPNPQIAAGFFAA